MINIAQRVSMLIIAILAMSILAACGISKGDLEDLQATSVVNTNNAMATSEAKTASMLKTAEANDDEEKAELMAQLTPTIDAEAQGECTVGENKPVDGTYKFCEDVDGEFTPTTPTPESTETPTPTPTATIATTQTPAATPTVQTEARVGPTATIVQTQVATAPTAPQEGSDTSGNPAWLGSQCVVAPNTDTVNGEVMKSMYTTGAVDYLHYPEMEPADPNRSGELFPDENLYGEEPRAGYEESWENNDYFEDCFGDTDVPQYNWRVVTTGYFWIPADEQTPEDIVCMATETKGCALIYINHYGPTMKVNGVYADNGFTVAGPTWDLSTPDKVTATAGDLVDHYVYRMIYADGSDERNDGTNCGVVEGCYSVEWHVVVYGNNVLLKHWAGTYVQQ